MPSARRYGFHAAREVNPTAFNNRHTNKLKMVYYGTPRTGALAPCLGRPPPQLHVAATVQVRRTKGGPWEPLKLPKRCVSLLLVNIRCHAAGRHPWEPTRAPWAAQSACDGKIDVVAFVSNTHATAYLMMGFGQGWQRFCAPRKLCQATAVSIELHEPMYCQADGEPWLQADGGKVTIEHAGTSVVLRAPSKERRRAAAAARGSATRASHVHAPAARAETAAEREMAAAREAFVAYRAALTLQARFRGRLARRRAGDAIARETSRTVANALTRHFVEQRSKSAF